MPQFTPDELPKCQDLLPKNRVGRVPDELFEKHPVDLGVAEIPVGRYTDQEFHDLEVEKVWRRVWQCAGFEADLAEVGDHFVYDIAGISIIVVRSGARRAVGLLQRLPPPGISAVYDRRPDHPVPLPVPRLVLRPIGGHP